MPLKPTQRPLERWKRFGRQIIRLTPISLPTGLKNGKEAIVNKIKAITKYNESIYPSALNEFFLYGYVIHVSQQATSVVISQESKMYVIFKNKAKPINFEGLLRKHIAVMGRIASKTSNQTGETSLYLIADDVFVVRDEPKSLYSIAKTTYHPKEQRKHEEEEEAEEDGE